MSFACAAHRVIADVDPDLGLVRVRDITTAQDVGRILNPTQAVGQIEGIGEPPTTSSSAAVAASIRNATGLPLPRIPIRPSDIALS